MQLVNESGLTFPFPASSERRFSKSCLPRKMMQNGTDEIFRGRTFEITSYLNLITFEFWALGPGSIKLFLLECCRPPDPLLFPGMPRHGTDRGTRRFMARPGTENLGTENLGTARHGKSWHGKILARHGPEENLIKLCFGENDLWSKINPRFPQHPNPTFSNP